MAAFVLANHRARDWSSPQSNGRDSKFYWDLRSAAASAQCPHQVDDAFADLGIADLDEGTIELKAFAAIQKLEDEGFGVRLGHSEHCVAIAAVRCRLEEELDRDVENLRDLKQPARADAVHALLVFLHL